MARYVLDTGVLVGFERGKHGVAAVLDELRLARADLIVPTVVVAEAWRGGRRSARIARLVSACVVQPLGERVARLAGEACAVVRGATTIDAVVAASAFDLRCALVTGDVDMRALASHFGALAIIDV